MKKKIGKIILFIYLGIVTILSLFPFYMVVIMSTYYTNDLYKGLPILPSDYLLKNIKTILDTNFIQVYGNSIMVSVGATVISAITSSLIGFALAKYKFKGRNVVYAFVLATMMVPTQVALIGYVLEMKSLNLINTLWPLIFAYAASPFCAFFMTQFIKSAVPDEILESARIDGCSEPYIFTKIVLPLIKPGITTVGILVYLWSWNNYLLPLVSVSDTSKYTIPLLISTLSSQFTTDFAAQMTAVGFSIIPIIILFIFGSKTFIDGLTAGAVKG